MSAEKAPKTIRLSEYKVPAFLIDDVDLRFELGAESAIVHSALQVRRNPASAEADAALRLNGEELQLRELRIDGRSLENTEYSFEEEDLLIPNVPASFRLESVCEIFPKNNTALSGLYESNGMFCTQCEAEGFRRITYFLDRPDVMSRFTTTIEADEKAFPILLGNGNFAGSGKLANTRHYARWVDPFPKPCYLFALVAGDLEHIEDEFTTCSGRRVPLRIYTAAKDIDKCHHAMESLKHSMKWDEEVYGREYDLDAFMIVSVDHFNAGAMENKGLNIFNSALVLAKPETATDDDYDRIEGVIAHEYFHNWSGDRVTCRDWFQLSLKEGFTVFRDQEFSADMSSPAVKRIEDVTMLRNRQFPEDAGPLAHPVRPSSYVEIQNFYTTTIYEKGAELLRMLRTILGKETFRKGSDIYFARHDGQAVTTDDFVKAMEEASGLDLTHFKKWYEQAGTPKVRAEFSHDAASNTFTLKLAQGTAPTPGQPVKVPLLIPVAMGLIDSQGREVPLRLSNEREAAGTSRVLLLDKAEAVYTFADVPAACTPSLLRGFSAPVNLECDYSDAQLAFLMANDSDSFNAWDAGQSLYMRVILRLIKGGAAVMDEPLDALLVEAVRVLLRNEARDPRLVAEAIRLPDEGYVMEQIAAADPAMIHAARQKVRGGLAAALRDEFYAIYEKFAAEPFSRDAKAVSRRRLKNMALGYLSTLSEPRPAELIAKQYDTCTNMTDSLSALAASGEIGGELNERLLADFYAKWQHESLVVDKWFAVQAGGHRTGTAEKVRQLLTHPAFTHKLPNRVRAVIGGFAVRNPANFHAACGSGYEFLAEQVLLLDKLNPQVAARMLGPLSNWRKLESGRSALMRAQLQRVLDTDGISKDVYEIAAKSLA